MIRNNWRYTVHFTASLLVLFCFLGGYGKPDWEAEDIPSEYRDYCSVYPGEADLETRKYWIFSKERMLLLSRPEDIVRIPLHSAEEDSVRITLVYRSFEGDSESGVAVSCGASADTVFEVSELMDPAGLAGGEGKNFCPCQTGERQYHSK